MTERRILRPPQHQVVVRAMAAGLLGLNAAAWAAADEWWSAGGSAAVALAWACLAVETVRTHVVVDDLGLSLTVWRTRRFAWEDVERLDRGIRWSRHRLTVVPRSGRPVRLPVREQDHDVVQRALAAVRAAT